MNKYRVSITYNLSPSLLWQWNDLLSNGVFIEDDDLASILVLGTHGRP
ncbi:hypothetical protein [Vulcanisaeta distributa]|nr:hypothetical protein [Vulcanisaeta distributa]